MQSVLRGKSSDQKSGISVAWFITWLLLACCFINSIPTSKGALVCAEERLVELEIDDERSDSRDFEFVLFSQIDERSTSQAWHDVQVFFCTQTSQVEYSANFERGPPSF